MTASIHALYARNAFVQHCPVPGLLGCELSDDGYIKTDTAQRTTVEGIYACGDSTTIMRTLANAVSTGTIAGMTANKDLIEEEF